MKYSEIKNLTIVEINKSLQKKQEELYEMRVKNNLGQLTNPLQIRFLKKDIARINTVISMKRLEV
ncbi:MAG: 50S ribosomal protein L29 [Deltaproteobacteria bacterium]|jgi:large subunit ribosomal protein L29|nr:50S ribosomal protein L29 [Deltaproteobacteria bacterium]